MLRSSKERRCYAAEFIGTFAIVFLGCGAIATIPESGSKSIAVNIVFGLVVATMICALGHVSKAHFNPAVTLGFVVSKRFPLRCAVGYWLAQFAGGILAALAVWQIAGGDIGATVPSVLPLAAIGLEAVLTFFLMLVICGVATDRRAPALLAGPAIGGVVLMNGLFAGSLTGNSLNPARSLGPALFTPEALPHLWIYFVGPCLGAVGAAVLYGWMAKGEQIPVCGESCC